MGMYLGDKHLDPNFREYQSNYSLSEGPRIVSEGLTNLYDTRDPRSYAGSGNDWKDVMGDFDLDGLVRNDGSGDIAPAFDTSATGSVFDFRGQTDSGQQSDHIDLVHATKFDFATDFAVEAWLYFDQVAHHNGATVWFCSSTLDELQYAVSATSQVGLALDGTWKGFVNTGLSLGSRWSCHLATRVGSTVSYYVDGVSRVSYTNTTAGNDNSALCFGEQRHGYGNHGFDGKIANIKIYRDKGLDASEALQNFNAQKTVFGL